LELATRLMEIKSRMMLPRHEEEIDKEEAVVEDPRQDIVQRLLEYKKYKDAASLLAEQGQIWQQRFARRTNDLITEGVDPGQQPLHEVELWDLVSAFARVVRDSTTGLPKSIRYDDTPIEVYMDRIRERLTSESPLAFTSLFQPGMHRSQMISIFLAVLELIRHHHVQVEQVELFGEIWISARSPEPLTEPAEDQQAA
jgi:segregation and condensation protein A